MAISIGEIILIIGIIINLLVVAFSYGKLNEKVDNFCKRLDRLEEELDKKVSVKTFERVMSELKEVIKKTNGFTK